MLSARSSSTANFLACKCDEFNWKSVRSWSPAPNKTVTLSEETGNRASHTTHSCGVQVCVTTTTYVSTCKRRFGFTVRAQLQFNIYKKHPKQKNNTLWNKSNFLYGSLIGPCNHSPVQKNFPRGGSKLFGFLLFGCFVPLFICFRDRAAPGAGAREPKLRLVLILCLPDLISRQ